MTFSPISQSDAVLAATLSVFGDRYSPTVPIKSIASDADRQAVHALLIEGFQNGTIRLSDKIDATNIKELNTYVSGLISNWWKKNPKLNGGVKYEPQTSRPQASSPVKAIMALRMECEAKGNQEGVQQCDAYLAKLEAEMIAKKNAIDESKIPMELRGLLKTA
jgi:hypothetical protein